MRVPDADDSICEHMTITGSHVDGTPWSFVVSLNDPETEFTGGGENYLLGYLFTVGITLIEAIVTQNLQLTSDALDFHDDRPSMS
jgi:hypothetical protein